MKMKLQHYNTLNKLSLYRPIGLQAVDAPRISRQSAREGGKVVSP